MDIKSVLLDRMKKILSLKKKCSFVGSFINDVYENDSNLLHYKTFKFKKIYKVSHLK